MMIVLSDSGHVATNVWTLEVPTATLGEGTATVASVEGLGSMGGTSAVAVGMSDVGDDVPSNSDSDSAGSDGEGLDKVCTEEMEGSTKDGSRLAPALCEP